MCVCVCVCVSIFPCLKAELFKPTIAFGVEQSSELSQEWFISCLVTLTAPLRVKATVSENF